MDTRTILLAGLAAGVLAAGGAAAQTTIRVVNMIPATMSNETHQDSEPDITVNPNDPNEIVASALTLNPTGATALAPVFCSQDGGATWTVSNIVPSANGMTFDMTVALSRNHVLYAGILRGGSLGTDMRILRGGRCPGAGTMTQLMGRTRDDQPYARAYTPMGGAERGRDHLYVGHNDTNTGVLPRTAFLEQSLDAATAAAPAGLAAVPLERRRPFDQNGPPVRQAIHPNGTVYAVYTQTTAYSGGAVGVVTGNVVVARDDDWGRGTGAYANLTDPGDGAAGRMVASGVSWVWNNGPALGQERLGDRVSIAVDPRDDRTVYVAWADRPAGVTGNTATLHVRRSTNGGSDWSTLDLRTIPGAVNPQLAVNVRGDVGFLYQQLTGTGSTRRWRTSFEQSTNGGTVWVGHLLADVPAGTPTAAFFPYLGDYAGLTAVGKDFYGVFSANNTPNLAHFPGGVAYQRSVTAGALTSGGGAAVAPSIDPFFFHVSNLAAGRDFYVRDWTHGPASRDAGVEPSTEPLFFATSDVWNRRSGAPGAFDPADRPVSEDPHPAALGTNHAFARVHRKAGGEAATVTLRFLKSELGTGSNYVLAGTAADPTLSFGPAETAKTLPAGYAWTLDEAASGHTCLAVEISAPGDPAVAPSLLGRAPGWPGTDLSVIYDNNKAQRNMGVYTGAGERGMLAYWAVVHNGATRRRDMVLQLDPDPGFARLFRAPRLDVAGGDSARWEAGRLVLPGMAPGENRWVRLTVPATPNQGLGERVSVSVSEMVGNLPVNGFTLAVERAPLSRAGVEGLRLLASNLRRAAVLLDAPAAASAAAELLGELPRDSLAPARYVELVRRHGSRSREVAREAVRRAGSDPFEVARAMDALDAVLRSGDPDEVFPRQSSLAHAMDAFLTYLDKTRGDVADVAQNMRWQAELLRSGRLAGRVEGTAAAAELAEAFDAGYAAGRLSAADYGAYVARSLPVLRRLDAALQLGQREALGRMEALRGDPRALQKAHRQLLLQLEARR